MSATLTSIQQDLVEKIALDNNFTNYDIETKSGTIKGDNYMGVISTVTIGDRDNPKNKLDLFLKVALSNGKLREVAPIRRAYEREIYLYQAIFPALERFEMEQGVESRFSEYAKCHGTSLKDCNECLILENLKEANFKLWDRMVPMNEPHAALVLKTYGKLHGSSLALKALHPEQFSELTKPINASIFVTNGPTAEAAKKFMEGMKPVFQRGYEAVAGNEPAIQCMNRFCEKFGDYYKLKYHHVENKYNVILHGDCWCNNMLFHYDDNDFSRPKEMRLLDWQLSHVGSPMLDLTYFLFANCGRETLDDYERLFKLYYYDTLALTLTQAGCDPEQVFPLDAFKKEWRDYSINGLFIALFVMKIVVSKPEDAVDIERTANEAKDIFETFSLGNTSNKELYDKRISDVVMFFVEHDLI